MNKYILESFIKKYYLSGVNETVKFVVKNTRLTVSSLSDNKLLRTSVELKDFTELPDCEFGVSDTTKLLKMLPVLNEDISFSLQSTDDKVTSIIISDGESDLKYVTSDLQVIPKSGTMKQLPDFQVTILIDKDFVTKYLSATSALQDCPYATFLPTKTDAPDVVIGHNMRGLNTTKVKIKPKVTTTSTMISRPLNFNAAHIKEILYTNKKIDNATLSVTDLGLVCIETIDDNCTSTYCVVEIKGE